MVRQRVEIAPDTGQALQEVDAKQASWNENRPIAMF
jgi:hypothetical protein